MADERGVELLNACARLRQRVHLAYGATKKPETRNPMGLTREQLLARLRGLTDPDDPEVAHEEADEALLQFIDDEEISEAYGAIKPKWYA